MHITPWGPLPSPHQGQSPDLPAEAFDACPGKGLNYPELCEGVFGAQPANWLAGCYRRMFVGYSGEPFIRRSGASGGVLTHTLLYLLETGLIDGAVVVQQGRPQPWLAEPVIAQTAEEILAASQSVYTPVPVNTLLERMAAFEGRLAYVGLPDQVASLRYLQQCGHSGALKVDYVLGPYVGTNNYLGAIESFLRSNGVTSLDEITRLRYREGEWPGYLSITTRSGRELRAEKFYYNYLIPFYITRSTLLSVDFTNELTDISVGDAWNPRYEAQGEGFSVVVARSPQGEELLMQMQRSGTLCLEDVALDDALAMHGHMLDFKKRGSFIRMGWRYARGRCIPDYGYQPTDIPLSRILVETVISTLFAVCGTYTARRLVELVPISILGPMFDTLRKSWKNVSKPVKRKGLGNVTFRTWRLHARS
jgi:coenzyme F420 hydrogenase subunit beta